MEEVQKRIDRWALVEAQTLRPVITVPMPTPPPRPSLISRLGITKTQLKLAVQVW